MRVWELTKLVAGVRSPCDTDHLTTSGTHAFLEIGRRVTDLGDSAAGGHKQAGHQSLDHFRMRTAVNDLVARDRCVNRRLVAIPTEPAQNGVGNIARETRVECDFDTSFAKRRKKTPDPRNLAHSGVADVITCHSEDKVRVNRARAVDEWASRQKR